LDSSTARRAERKDISRYRHDPNGDELVNQYLSTVAAAQARWRLATATGELTFDFRSWVAAFIAGANAAALLGIVGMRIVQDFPLIHRVRAGDPLAAALLILEIGPLFSGAFLGVAAAAIAWMSWFHKTPRRWPAVATFILITGSGVWVLIRTAPYFHPFGWLVVVLGLLGLISQITFPEGRTSDRVTRAA
jgi:hypothetical protein